MKQQIKDEVKKLHEANVRMLKRVSELPAYAKVAAPALVRETEIDINLINAGLRQIEYLLLTGGGDVDSE